MCAWNCHGWSMYRNNNSIFRKLVLENTNCDIFAVCETFLRGTNELDLPGFKWIGHDRPELHRNAVRESGSVGMSFKVVRTI